MTIASTAVVGCMGGNSLEMIKKDTTRVEHVVIFLAVTFLALFLLVQYIRSGRQAAH